MTAQVTVNSISNTKSLISLISGADFTVQIIMLLLFIASIWSWAIIIDKYLCLRKVKQKINNFEHIFSEDNIASLFNKLKNSVSSPIEHVFVSAMNEYGKILTNKNADKAKNKIDTIIFTAKNKHIGALEKNLSYLATISSAAPFIGLLGTVWGIMHSFQSIAASKNTSLAVVAPGIAEALLATALGLLAAIPALIFYNILTAKIHEIENRLANFATELSSILSHRLDADINE